MPSPENIITFEHPRTLLRINGNIIESRETSAHQLYDILITAETQITQYIDSVYERNLSVAKNPETATRPIIQIARLALNHELSSIYNYSYIEEPPIATSSPERLTEYARTYWDTVTATSFQPHIQIRGARALEGTRGVWLSLKTSE